MLNQISVGQPSKQADGSNPTQRGGNLGEAIFGELHGCYYEQAYRGNIFNAATQALVTTTVGLATTYTGLCLSNPIGSGVNLAVNKCTMMQSIIQSTQIEAFGIAVGYNASTAVTHTTPVTPRSNFIGSGITPRGLADVSATLPTAPFYHTFVTNTQTATQNAPGGIIDLQGSLILPPGGYALWVSPAQASVAGMWFSFQWEEVPA